MASKTSGKSAWDKEKTRELFRRFKEEGDQVIALALAEREEEKEGAEESAQEMQSPAAEESGQEDKQE